MGRLLCFTLGVVLLVPVPSLAAPPSPPPPPPPADLPPPPPPPPPAGVECFPTCGPGSYCDQGLCRSICNPPCAAGDQCLESGQCVRGGGSAAEAPEAPSAAGRSDPTISEDGERAPLGFHFERRRSKGLLITGPVLFGVGYIFSLLYGVFGYSFANLNFSSGTSFTFINRNSYLLYAVPLAGPALSQVAFAAALGYRSTNRGLEFLYAGVVTVLQVTGLVLALLGIKSREVLVEDHRADASSRPPPLRWSIAPLAPGAPLGLSVLVEN